jgi:hypothetical protein
MTGFNYARATATADRLIARFGQSGLLRQITKSGTAYSKTATTTVDHPVSLVITEYDVRLIDGVRILASDRKALVAVGSLTVEPTPADHLVDAAGAVYKIVNIQPINPGGTVVMWEVQARR